jgi:hypothetical protein
MERPILNEYFESVLACGFIPKITLPTRLTRYSGTLIDNFLCRIAGNFSASTAGILMHKVSDHQPIFICLDYLQTKNTCPKYVKISKRNDAAITKFKEFLKKEANGSTFSNDPNLDPNCNYEKLNQILKLGLDTCMPTRMVKYNKHKHPNNKWITSGIIRSISFKDKLYLKLKSTSSASPLYDQLKTNLKTYNNILKRAIREPKKSYYHHCFEIFKNDIKNTWKTIKDIINKTKCKNKLSEHFLINNIKVTDKCTIAEEFNNYFINLGPSLASHIEKPHGKSFEQYLKNPVKQKFNFNQVTCNSVIEIIDKLRSKTSTGFDNISTILLKKIKHELVNPLTLTINQALNTGIFPDKLKIAKVIPLFKKNDPTLLDNYRPISVLPAISKVFEKVIFSQIHNFFKTHDLYFPNQYGFRELHSTELAHVELVDRIIFNMDEGKSPLNIYMDLSKAFDTIDHDILLFKLKHYGFTDSSLLLMKSYLNNREQFVDVEGITSSKLKIETGVPQGSILGPLLFIFYILMIICICQKHCEGESSFTIFYMYAQVQAISK